MLAVHNLSGREVETTIELGRKVEGLFDLLQNCDRQVDGDGRQRVRLAPYGYRWMRLGRGLESLQGQAISTQAALAGRIAAAEREFADRRGTPVWSSS